MVCKFCIFYINPYQANLAKHPAIQRDAIAVHTGFVQVVRQLYRRLHLHVGLEDAAAERGLVVGLLRLGLDGRLHPALGDVGGDGAGPAHGSPVARSVHHGVTVRLLRAPKKAKGAVCELHAKRKLLRLLQGRQRVAAHGIERASGFDTCC